MKKYVAVHSLLISYKELPHIHTYHIYTPDILFWNGNACTVRILTEYVLLTVMNTSLLEILYSALGVYLVKVKLETLTNNYLYM